MGCFVYMTASDRDEARRIARALVEARLAACANIHEGHTSVYWWEGEVREETECAIIAKTRADLVPALTDMVTSLHSYDCPCVVTMDLTGGNQAFFEWIESETVSVTVSS